MSAGPLLLVEDDRDDVQLTLLGFRAAGFEREILVARDGVEALELLRTAYGQSRPLPAAILTDLKMPRMDGLELLQRLKSEPRFRHVPVLVLTTSGYEADMKEALRLGALRYFRKPADLDGYGEIVSQARKAMGLVPAP